MGKKKIVEPLKTPLRIAHVGTIQAWIANADNRIVIVCYAKNAELIVNAVNAYAEAETSIETTSSEEEK